MMTLDTMEAGVLAAVLALWLVAGVWATFVGVRGATRSRALADELARHRVLLATSPALPLTIAGDGRLQGDERLADWLGLRKLPRYLQDLVHPGTIFSAPDADGLAADIAAAQRTALTFSRPLRVIGSTRILLVQGKPDASAPAGGVVLWFFDTTEGQQEIEQLRADAGQLNGAVSALSALIEAAPFPMWHRGPDLRLALVNTAYVQAVEAENAAEVVSRGLDLAESVDGKTPIAAAAAAREAGKPQVRIAPATIAGERRTIRIVDVPLGEAGVAGYAVDVEDIEQARADLSRFVRAQRDMLDLLSAGVAQFGADRTLVFTNQPFRRIFAMRPEWLTDRPEFDRVLERMREAGRLPESRDFPGWKAERRAWFTITAQAAEENWLLPGGLHLRVVAQPLPDGGLLLIFEDRTEQVQLASARDTLLRVRTATFDNLFEAVAVFAADGRLSLWNSRFRDIWALEEEELAEHPRVDALVETMGRQLSNPARARLIRELVRVATTERRQRSGRVALANGRHFEFAAVPLPDGNALFTMLDITDSRRIEAALRDRNEALEEADKLKSAFVESMSYELRTPLTTIGGFAEMLAHGYAGKLEPTAGEYVGAILESVARLGGLIDDILDLSQSEAGNLPIKQEPVAVAELVEDTVNTVRAVAEEKRIELVLAIDPDVGTVGGDMRRLRQALDHIVRNAVSYTPAGGRVLAHAAAEEDGVLIVISDNGEGIAAEDQHRLLHRFNSPLNASPNGRRAAGLGLPLSRRLIEAHGGKLTLMSEPGEGTSVLIHLPRRRDEDPDAHAG